MNGLNDLNEHERERENEYEQDYDQNYDQDNIANIADEDERLLEEHVTFKPDMIRPTLYRCVSRCVTAFTLALLWKKFWSGVRPLSDAFTVAAICLFAMAWFSYLRLDGMTFRHFLEERKKKRKLHATLDLTDFADEHIIRDEEMLPMERTLCSFIASLIAGAIFLVALLVSMLVKI